MMPSPIILHHHTHLLGLGNGTIMSGIAGSDACVWTSTREREQETNRDRVDPL